MNFDRTGFDPAQAVALARKTFEIEAAAVLNMAARVGKGTRHDDGHRVIEEGAFHLLLDLDGLDRAGKGCSRDRTFVGRRIFGWGVVAHDVSSSPNGGVLRCRGSARPWRWSG